MNTRKHRRSAAQVLAIFLPAVVLARGPIGGTIHMEDGASLHFRELVSMIFSLAEGAESIPQNVNEWPLVYDSETVSRSVPLAWVRSVEVRRHETRKGYRCLFNAVLAIETVSGVVMESEFKTLEWIRVRTAGGEDRTVYFAVNDTIQVRKILFNTN